MLILTTRRSPWRATRCARSTSAASFRACAEVRQAYRQVQTIAISATSAPEVGATVTGNLEQLVEGCEVCLGLRARSCGFPAQHPPAPVHRARPTGACAAIRTTPIPSGRQDVFDIYSKTRKRRQMGPSYSAVPRRGCGADWSSAAIVNGPGAGPWKRLGPPKGRASAVSPSRADVVHRISLILISMAIPIYRPSIIAPAKESSAQEQFVHSAAPLSTDNTYAHDRKSPRSLSGPGQPRLSPRVPHGIPSPAPTDLEDRHGGTPLRA